MTLSALVLQRTPPTGAFGIPFDTVTATSSIVAVNVVDVTF
jgi:hypothetical protein